MPGQPPLQLSWLFCQHSRLLPSCQKWNLYSQTAIRTLLRLCPLVFTAEWSEVVRLTTEGNIIRTLPVTFIPLGASADSLESNRYSYAMELWLRPVHLSEVLHIWSASLAYYGLQLGWCIISLRWWSFQTQLEMPAECACMRTGHTLNAVYKITNVPVLKNTSF